MKRMVSLVFVLFLVACGGQKLAPVAPGATVLVLGDSLSYGTGAAPGEEYPRLLAGKTGWNIINASVPGDTTAGGLERLPALLEQHAPKLLVVELGGNDFLQQLPQQQILHNFKAILSLAKARGIPVVVVAVPRPNLLGAAVGSLSDAPLYEQIAEETGVPVVNDVIALVLSKNTLKSDPIHPNAEGYRQVAEGLFTALQEMGLVSAQ